VALTRAKHGLFVVGNAKNFEKKPIWEDLVKVCKHEGKFFNNVKEAKEYILLKKDVWSYEQQEETSFM